MNRNLLSLCVVTLALLTGVGANAGVFGNSDRGKVVNCDKGMNPQHFLDQRLFSRPIKLYLVGTCPALTIERDDVLIAGHPDVGCPGATVNGIIVNASDRVELRCLKVTESTNDDDTGIWFFSGTGTLYNVEIVHNNGVGLLLGSGAYVEMFDSFASYNNEGIVVERSSASLENVIVNNNDGAGLMIEHNSSVEFLDGLVGWNGGSGFVVRTNSSLEVDSTHIPQNGESGINARDSAFVNVEGGSITDNGQAITNRSGIFLYNNSTGNVTDVMISANQTGIGVYLNSTANVQGGTTLDANRANGMTLRYDSSAIVGPGVQIPPNGSGLAIVCHDTESSVSIRSGGVGPSDCDGFNLPPHDHPHVH